MILTVTPNPSLDRTYVLSGFQRGELNRARNDTVEASGKGVNVARVLHSAGVRTAIVLPAGGPEGAQLAALLEAEGLSHRIVPTGAPVRTNVTLLEPGRTTKVNAPGTPLTPADADALIAAVEDLAHGADWVVCSGSLPPDTPVDLIGEIVEAGRRAGAQTAVDASGEALRAAADAGPDVLAPNADELAELTGRMFPPGGRPLVRAALDAASALAGDTGGGVLVSLGPDGAVWVDPESALHAAAPPVTPVNTAGAGDALLAGWLAGPPEPGGRLRTAVAWGTAACLLPSTAGDVAATADADRVHLHDLGVTAAGP
ncbi:1-phosphofructokinase family hexose kinase [Cryptosporangium phraense]|uniref:1-phosphofructokinase family hexose kinase n=1 Tax=Cryptosporangium phraense TaxID=2593070 RepID=A0A545AUP9_9ACTN|nr:1-phosphofructokinase family hexose kinase [Cryptosporangium phraense]TQS45001.1 1-phosphofructokinase family hexose kinase [Cryptosporangium phraense]